MEFEQFRKTVSVLSEEQGDLFRALYIETFIDTTKEWYRKYIAVRKKCSDGLCYSGYLWEYLKECTKITEQELKLRLSPLSDVFVMWDIHSKDRIVCPGYWKFKKDAVIKVPARALLEGLDFLPDDIYIFDQSLKWSLIFTHEDDGKRRICFMSGTIE